MDIARQLHMYYFRGPVLPCEIYGMGSIFSPFAMKTSSLVSADEPCQSADQQPQQQQQTVDEETAPTNEDRSPEEQQA